MNIQSRVLLAGLLAAAVVSANAQTKPAAAAAQAQARQADAVTQKAEALTVEQIGESKDIAGLTRLSEVYNAIGDMPRFTRTVQRLTELLPDSGQLKLQLAMIYASQNDKTRAYDVLVRMQGQGYGYDISKEPRFEPIHGTKVWDYVVANMQANAKQFGEGTNRRGPLRDYLNQMNLRLEDRSSQPLAILVVMQTGGSAPRQFRNYSTLETMLREPLMSSGAGTLPSTERS